MGSYVARIYDEVKLRPLYLLRDDVPRMPPDPERVPPERERGYQNAVDNAQP
jgi:hypothetical protein